jgi:hypothetical protein
LRARRGSTAAAWRCSACLSLIFGKNSE